MLDPLAWTPYPDTGDVLKTLAAQGIPVAVVSNIAFDIRPAFAANGWDRLVAAHTLSFEVGAVKPDLRIFPAAVAQLGVRPESALMVGDSAEADGGAVAAGRGSRWSIRCRRWSAPKVCSRYCGGTNWPDVRYVICDTLYCS